MSKTESDSNNHSIIAIPVAGGRLCMHFGHCEEFALYEVDSEKMQIIESHLLTPPPHEPGVLPRWLHRQGVDLVIVGGMGQRAQNILIENSVRVIAGAPSEAPESIMRSYLDGKLQLGQNACDH